MSNPYSLEDLAPIINDLEDVKRFEEAVPYPERYPLQSSYEVFEYAAKTYGDDCALRFLLNGDADEASTDFSFKELFARINQSANALHHLGLRSTDPISILLANIPHAHFAIWGAQAAGISSPMNPALDANHLIQILNTTKSTVLITTAPLLNDPGHWQKVEALLAKVPTLKRLLYITVDGYTEAEVRLEQSHVEAYNFDVLCNDQASDRLVSNRVIKGSEIASYFHTGGTTGRPKIAMVTHANISFVSQLLRHLTAYRERSVTMSCLPLFHIYGLIAAGIATLHAGRTIVMMTPDGFRNSKVVKNWWHHIARFNVASFGGVPTILSALLDVPTGDNDLSCLLDVGCGAAPLPNKLRRDFEQKLNVRVTNGYGMTESTCVLTRQRAEAPGPDGCVGTRYPYTQIRIVELDGSRVVRDCGPNQSGVLIVKGPHIFKGYLNPEDNAKAWADGDWFNTGDVGFVDEKGWITLTGRAKDLIIRGGHNIDPVIIEEPLQKHSAVAEVVAVGQPDPYAGEIPVAYVRLKPGHEGSVSAEELMEYGKDAISERAAIPKRIEILEQFPVTAVGKFFKPALRRRATEFALMERLQAIGVAGDVQAHIDEARGIVARVSVDDPAQLDAARAELERFPLVVEFAS